MELQANLYQYLGLKPSATDADIKKAYRRYASKLHPDKHSNDDFFTRRFREIQSAYDVLSDAQKRSKYDNRLSAYKANYIDDLMEFRRERMNELEATRKELAKERKKNIELKLKLDLFVNEIEKFKKTKELQQVKIDNDGCSESTATIIYLVICSIIVTVVLFLTW